MGAASPWTCHGFQHRDVVMQMMVDITSTRVHAVESSSKASVANTELILDLLVTETPLEHEGAHTETLACATKGTDHLLDIVIAKDATPSATHTAHGTLALILEKLTKHLVEQLEVGLCLLVAIALAKPGLDGEEDFASVEEVVGEDVEAVGLLGHHGEVLEHADRDTVAEAGGLVAELEARALSLCCVCHDAALFVVEGSGHCGHGSDSVRLLRREGRAGRRHGDAPGWTRCDYTGGRRRKSEGFVGDEGERLAGTESQSFKERVLLVSSF
ncbi:hypothetical protein HG530_008190 [Fusarium avenaceum]|nr:hypothetical protein HG530_008190 [Fusarium avenaceum]